MNVAATTAAEGFPRRAFTVEDISRMIEAGIIHEDEKFELVEGEIVMMASKRIAHERIKSALNIAVVRALPDHLTMGVEVTLRLTNTIMLEPDIAVFPKELFKKSSAGFAQLDPGEAYLVSNSHFGGERDFEGECDLLNRGAFRQCAGRGESDSSSVWERSRTLYRGCGRPVRVCRTSGAGKTSITSWPISAWRRLHRFSCRARRFSPISGTWRTGTAMVARTARRCLG